LNLVAPGIAVSPQVLKLPAQELGELLQARKLCFER
jgi:hypothetical protein